MGLVDDDEIEEIRRILTEVRRRFAVLRWPAHERLEDGEEKAAILWDLALLANALRLDPDHCVFREGRECVVSLVGEDVAVGEEQDSLSSCFSVCERKRSSPIWSMISRRLEPDWILFLISPKIAPILYWIWFGPLAFCFKQA